MVEIIATRQPMWRGLIEIRIVDRDAKACVKRVMMEPADESMEIPIAMRIQTNQAQMLMDQLWECGLRPTEGTGSAGALSAVERHLADMRSLAFHALNIEKGGK